MLERSWKLGEDLVTSDNLFDQIRFDDLIIAVHCNCREITPAAVCDELRKMILSHLDDATELLEINIAAIMRLAAEGRE